jgi:energy-coupling factor transporter ATP-binding protein EcfA2
MTMATNGAAVETSGVSFVYEGGHQALFDVDVRIGAGEFLALVGQNGSGKTTLAKHFNGILRPTSGRVTIDGVDVADQSTTSLAGRIGYCYQNPDHQIFAHTVRAELEFGPQNLGVDAEVVRERVERLLDVVGLKHMADSYPFGLSRGERQKVAVASVLAMEPQVVIVDEPTTGLDWLGGQAMMDIIRGMHDDGRTVIVITHDMHLVAEYAERVIVMADGRKVADGSPGAVFREDAALERAALRPPQVFRMSRLVPDLLGDGSLTVEAAVAHLDTLGHAAAVGDEY